MHQCHFPLLWGGRFSPCLCWVSGWAGLKPRASHSALPLHRAEPSIPGSTRFGTRPLLKCIAENGSFDPSVFFNFPFDRVEVQGIKIKAGGAGKILYSQLCPSAQALISRWLCYQAWNWKYQPSVDGLCFGGGTKVRNICSWYSLLFLYQSFLIYLAGDSGIFSLS